MPKHSKSGGPPYTDPPSATYVVVVKPWSVEPSPGRRKMEDYNRIATWVTYVLWEAANRGRSVPAVECVYRMRTRDEVIVQLPLGTNTSPLLGQHNWASFVDGNGPPQKATLVFEYNWTNNGDPANHNWEEFFPDILPLNSVPVKSPYPPPLWVKVPVTLTSFVLSITKPLTPPPEPELQCPLIPLKSEPKQIELKSEVPDEKPADLSSLFRPYSPPSHYPLPARSQNQSMGSKKSEKPRLFRKHDPYEVEREAEQLVCSFKSVPTEEDKKFDSYLGVKNDPDDAVKSERSSVTPADYQPSAELLAAFSSLSESMLPGGSTFSQKMQPPSDGLKREHTEESITSTKRVKLEDS